MSWDFTDTELQQHIDAAEYGIEKESLRVTPDGRPAQTLHPFVQNNIDRDFCENQVEMISSVHYDTASLFGELEELHRIVYDKLRGMDELLWPFSNPSVVLSEDEVPVARFEGALKEREIYRNYLARKYGKAKMLYSGIHFNFSFSEDLLRAAFKRSCESDFRSFKDSVYVELARKLLRYTWLIVYLTAASPLVDESFLRLNGLPADGRYRYASMRCSDVGYWNDFLPILDFSDVRSYVQSIERYIDLGLLYAASELYYPLRLKPRGKNALDTLREKGVNHIELRCLDVNPLSRIGLFEEDIRFIHLMMLWLMSLSDTGMDERSQRAAINNIKTAAYDNDTENTIDLDGRKVPLREAAAQALSELHHFAQTYAPDFLTAVTYQEEKPRGKRYAAIVRERFTDYIGGGLKLAKEYRG